MHKLRLRTKIIFWVVVTLTITQAFYFYLMFKDRSEQSFEMTKKASRQLSAVIKKTLEQKMEKNQLEDVEKTVEIIGKQKDVENVMIIDKKGQIAYSARKDEIGNSISMEEESCNICHQQKPYPHDEIKVFTLGEERILRNVNPIRNDEKCYGCHGRKDRILGVLVVDTSLLPLDEELRSSRGRMIFFAVATSSTVALLLALLIFILVDRPIRKLAGAVSDATEGRLDSKIDIVSGDELGKLGKGFNIMLEKIAQFNQELQEKIKLSVEECRKFNVELMRVNRHLEEANEELKRSQEQIVQSEKMVAVGQLASGVAHEINNPLGSILTYIKLALKKIDMRRSQPDMLDLPQLRGYIATVEEEVNRCKIITRSLLDFSRVKEPEMTLVNINEVLDELLKIIEHQSYEQNVTLQKKFDVLASKIVADANQLQQVFINIILNALHAMSDGGVLEITTKKHKRFVKIVFKDSGCGILEEDLLSVFTPFFTTKKVGEGTGLGLSVAYGIIKNHGGNIKVLSRVGEGTTVIISLPLSLDSGNPGYGKIEEVEVGA